MPDIMMIFACVSQCLDPTTLRQLCRVTEAMLAMTGRVTMRGMARWAGTGGSDRTIQRFFTKSLQMKRHVTGVLRQNADSSSTVRAG